MKQKQSLRRLFLTRRMGFSAEQEARIKTDFQVIGGQWERLEDSRIKVTFGDVSLTLERDRAFKVVHMINFAAAYGSDN